MKRLLNLLSIAALSLSLVAAVGCGEKEPSSSTPASSGPSYDLTTTKGVVEYASTLTLAELEAKAKEEMEASNSTFKVVGLTSTLAKALTSFCDKYDWITSEDTYCNNSYKDYALLTALEQADTSYFADFALVQDARSLADYMEAGITHNFVPSDYADLGLAEKDTYPLKGIYFNKIFYTNNTLDVYDDFTNIWQIAGTDADAKHIGNFSFQSPITEQINMSFLISCLAESNQDRIEKAYKAYYNVDWSSTTYASCGEQFITELIANVSKWHSSDGTAMKETQYADTTGYVYYGAFAKMKDAAGISAANMATVGWDKEIEGFNGFMYCMYSQIVNKAEHPYTACLYARHLLTPDCYTAMCYNSSTPNKAGEKANMYGYYYPCASTTVGINDNDWTKDKWIDESIVEDYEYLSGVKTATVNNILALVSSNKKAS